MSTKLSHLEHIKSASRYLRGTIAEGLADPVTGAIGDDDNKLLKFHGSYQQDDRDLREERRKQKLEPAYAFMLRARLPSGVVTPAQWLVFDRIAREHASGTLRITTRQTFQWHGIIKHKLKPTIAAIHEALATTIAACGDVVRNVVSTANPVESAAHAEAYAWATRLSTELAPKTRAYHEIWLDGEKLHGDPVAESEPLYGATYLPRKFKIGLAIPPLNDIDVFAQDLGLIAIVEQGTLRGFNIAVGGGMGATHGDASTYPRLANVIGFATPEQLFGVAEAVIGIQRDWGDRAERQHARLKYTLDRHGLDAFKAELEARLGYALAAPRAYRFEHNGDRYGWVEGHDGRWHLTLHIESGRLADTGERRWLSGLRELAKVHAGDFRLTCNQNVIVANVAAAERERIDAIVREHGLDGYRKQSAIRRHAIACVALPTCGLAMAESERYLPALLPKLEALLEHHGLADAPILLRLSGCPNGCSRPYLGEIALVGRGPGRYDLRLGADFSGQRLNQVYRENVDEAAILAALDPLFARYAAERAAGEGFGDFLLRAGILAPLPSRRIPSELVA
ncbi:MULTISPECIES: assimilatory sulfite reductase (NADPH) hemoprotein subunit [Rhodanobacter]|uniref:assimilatory sulfite reductase (NADPH) hemoprotein subunit n=1 Tax=Rhodanobacter TaxID=75309 RepID=UPI0003FF5C44|nr:MULTISPECIES: assimilatory sulfite reductase (NADPH) hemoprotein subunit [Rhodanobacter]TAN15578.1 MAG: assimilatory sulfite reductase (NADPH) hemoprotein subunit [Rhodanobacter sp.]UJJ53184.1 assimilatory sulfite reductase (NADPH) hemoprotein subunit [Rhodanobacter thiooxydans]